MSSTVFNDIRQREVKRVVSKPIHRTRPRVLRSSPRACGYRIGSHLHLRNIVDQIIVLHNPVPLFIVNSYSCVGVGPLCVCDGCQPSEHYYDRLVWLNFLVIKHFDSWFVLGGCPSLDVALVTVFIE